MSDLYCPLQKSGEKSSSSPALLNKSFECTYLDLEKKATSFFKALTNSPHKTYILSTRVISLETIAWILACFRAGKSLFLPNVFYPPLQIQALQKKLQAQELPIFEKPFSKTPSYFSLEKGSVILTTSGSSGEPKLVELPFSALFYNALGAASKLFLEQNDIYFLSLPLFHVSGLSILFRALLQKATIYIPSKKEELYNHFHRSHLSLVPTQLYKALQLPKEQLLSWKKSLKAIHVGGAFCSRILFQEAQEKGLPVFLSYGLTEMGSQVLLTNTPFWKGEIPYLGLPSFFQEATISAEKELLVKGKTLFTRYWDTPPSLKEGWFPTKDLASFDSEKGYAILGRKDRMFISGGENIYPEEIERALVSIPKIQKAHVVPYKDEKWGYIGAAYIESTENISLTKLYGFLEKKLPSYKFPKKVFSWKSLPHKKEKLDYS